MSARKNQKSAGNSAQERLALTGSTRKSPATVEFPMARATIEGDSKMGRGQDTKKFSIPDSGPFKQYSNAGTKTAEVVKERMKAEPARNWDGGRPAVNSAHKTTSVKKKIPPSGAPDGGISKKVEKVTTT